ncbi:MAG: 3-oxoadipyl-CoA thiolase [Cytophagales bacterium]|nr:MAG: 3-oxoadipyl-CoA thiolase [Cytophagales bacterium]TAF61461.1 MAG: 3-oxoadipyl-CoA thiolase [Cytophagales bacterium]
MASNPVKRATKAFIIDGIRTPIGNFGGCLATIRPDDLAALVLKKLFERQHQVDLKDIADVLLGCANQAGEDNRNVARMAVLLAGLPQSIPAETLNRLCASGMSAVAAASRAIWAEEGLLYVAGGVESMTRAPYVISKSAQAFGRDAQFFDTSFGWRFINPKLQAQYGTHSMGETAENLAEMYQISRADQDAFALSSQLKAAKAQASGFFAEHIVPVPVQKNKNETVLIEKDEFIKPQSTLEALRNLKPAFKKEGSVTAGNASGLNDGAIALLMASSEGAEKYQLKPLAEVVSTGIYGVEPKIMGIGPVKASQMALERAGLKLSDLAVIEINEAFAAQVLACSRQLGIADDDKRLNPNGGAIALGHPLGMSGARIVLQAAKELQRAGGEYALCTMCVGVGQGYAVVIKRA